MEFNYHTLTATLELAVYIETFHHHRILRTKLLNQESLKNRLILSLKNLFIVSFINVLNKSMRSSYSFFVCFF
jgi:hypothetical protein